MDIFLLKLILSFIVGGSYIALTIWISEKYGSKLGGILTGLPTTLLISIIFIAWTQGQQTAVAAMPIVPAAVAASSLFLVTYIYSYRKNWVTSLILAILVWFIISLSLIFANIGNIYVSIFLAVVFFTIAIKYLNRFPHRKLKSYNASIRGTIIRILSAGIIVALAVLLSKLLGPLWGGLFASFPAAFSSSIVLLTLAHGINFASSVGKTMSYGSIGNVAFVVSFFLITPIIGIILGIILSYMIVLIYAVILYKFILRSSSDKVIESRNKINLF